MEELKEQFLTREQVAELCHVTPTTIFRWDKAGTIKSYGLGIKALYKKEEILDQILGR
jgi:predicted site-specific integrase-resolvase